MDQGSQKLPTRYIAAALIQNGDSYLFIKQNKEGGAYPDSLHLPGGGIDEGENPEEAIRREIQEEVGLDVGHVERIDFDWDVVDYKGKPTLLVFFRFLATYIGGEAVPQSDAKEILWLTKNEILKFHHNPPSLRFLKRLGLI